MYVWAAMTYRRSELTFEYDRVAEKEPGEEAEAVPSYGEYNQTQQGGAHLRVIAVLHTTQRKHVTYKTRLCVCVCVWMSVCRRCFKIIIIIIFWFVLFLFFNQCL